MKLVGFTPAGAGQHRHNNPTGRLVLLPMSLICSYADFLIGVNSRDSISGKLSGA